VANDARIDVAAEGDIEWLKSLMLGVRNIRGEMNIGPGKPLQLFLKNVSAEDQRRLNENEHLLKKLAKLESFTVLEAGAEAPLSATALVGEMEVLAPEVIAKERAKMAEAEQALGKLAEQHARIASL
jgi:valyl-tRNA synthetase